MSIDVNVFNFDFGKIDLIKMLRGRNAVIEISNRCDDPITGNLFGNWRPRRLRLYFKLIDRKNSIIKVLDKESKKVVELNLLNVEPDMRKIQPGRFDETMFLLSFLKIEAMDSNNAHKCEDLSPNDVRNREFDDADNDKRHGLYLVYFIPKDTESIGYCRRVNVKHSRKYSFIYTQSKNGDGLSDVQDRKK